MPYVSDDFLAGVIAFRANYDVTMEVLGHVQHDGYLVRYHADDFAKLRDFLCDQYGSNETFPRGMADRNHFANNMIDRHYLTIDPFYVKNTLVADAASDLAIELLTLAGHSPDDKDAADDSMGDVAQTLLMEVLCRSKNVFEMLSQFEQVASGAIVRYRELSSRVNG